MRTRRSAKRMTARPAVPRVAPFAVDRPESGWVRSVLRPRRSSPQPLRWRTAVSQPTSTAFDAATSPFPRERVTRFARHGRPGRARQSPAESTRSSAARTESGATSRRSPRTSPQRCSLSASVNSTHRDSRPCTTEPIVFLKAPDTVVGAQDEVRIPRNSSKTDWEVELAVVRHERPLPARPRIRIRLRRRLHDQQRRERTGVPARARRPVGQRQEL